MVELDHLFIENNDIKLEAELFQSKSTNKNLFVLICHPHPQYGGNMYNNVVSGIFNKLIKNDISCIRFNFRGVGRSSGSHSDGTGELSDVHACINFLLNEKKCEKVILCGYSYGAVIGCSAVGFSDKIVGYISISFPWGVLGLKYKELSQTTKSKLFIQGNRDTVVSYENFDSNYNYYHPPKSKIIIEGADHFYSGYEDTVAEQVINFLNNF
ncbi:MAG: alpha/beta hydrolase [Promethearchaeota archaeon]|jgi:alpha/beta superfamily hydrolase